MFSIITHRSVSRVYKQIIFHGRYSKIHCPAFFPAFFFFSRHLEKQEAGILFMSHPVFGPFQPRRADQMTLYCLPTENKLYIHLDGLPRIFVWSPTSSEM